MTRSLGKPGRRRGVSTYITLILRAYGYIFLLSKNIKIKIYRRIILSDVLYGCGTWSLTLREERRLWVFENKVLRRIFGPKREKVIGECRKIHNEELNDLYSSPNIFPVIKSGTKKWPGHVVRMGEWRGLYRVLCGET
jgi:hypothetical protein